MAVDIGFYHCTRDPVVEVAVRLCAKAHEQGQRLLVLAGAERLELLDRALWEQIPDSFLPHGCAGGPDDGDQPILLSEEPLAGNGARLLMLVDRGVPADLDGFDRLLNLFADGCEAHARARLDWKALAGRDGVERSYWQQNARGGWTRKEA